MKLVVATGNEGKAVELRAGLVGVEVETLRHHQNIEMPEETGETFEANAVAKAEHVAAILGVPTIADDSGLEVDALDGAPGVHSARYAEGTDADRYKKLLGALVSTPDEQRTARFVCAMALAVPGDKTIVLRGVTEGRIIRSPRGNSGFGYDPVFLTEDGRRTMAELSADEKNRISHRGRALAAMRPYLAQHFSLE